MYVLRIILFLDVTSLLSFFVLFNSIQCKPSSGGHLSSQRARSGYPSGGNQLPNSPLWSSSWLTPDSGVWYDNAYNESDLIPDEQRLLAQLLRNYDPSARPVYNASDTVSVAFGIALTQLSDMDERNQILTTNIWLEQEWMDQRLVWNASDFNGLTTLRLPCSKIWLPDIVLYNSADDYTQGYYQSKAMIDNTGHVFWPPPAKFRSSCKIDVTFFPFDDQLCKLKFGSWTYDAAQVNLTKRRDNVDMTNYIRSGEWDIIRIFVQRNDVTYACCPGIFYPDVTIYVHIRRRVLYYLFNIIFPCIWLSILSVLGFWLPPDSGEKITLGITVLLAFSVFMLLIAESMPATSEMVPLIEIYLTAVMAFTSLSIVLTVYVLQLHHSGPVVIPIPHTFKNTLVRYIAPVIGMSKTIEIYAREHNLLETDDVYRYFSQRPSLTSDMPTRISVNKGRSEKQKVKYRQNAKQTKDLEYDDENYNEEEEMKKEFLPNIPTTNGDLLSVSSSNKRHRHPHHQQHRSRRAAPPIVLIPQQSSSSPIPSHSRSQYNLFNSNMHLLEKHLKYLLNKQKLDEERSEIVNEWKLMALIMDRLLFWLFTIFTILSTVLCLTIIPILKNAGYISALSGELLADLKSVETTMGRNAAEQMKVNLTGAV